jgi:ATP-dependent DNA ligase
VVLAEKSMCGLRADRAVREQRLEGVVGKRRDSIYEPGKRSGLWIKHRVNLGQEFVIGGFTPGPHGLDAIIVGYYRGHELIYVVRTRNRFVPASRRRLFEKLKPLESAKAAADRCRASTPLPNKPSSKVQNLFS